jgi:hypothetical protein
MDVLTGFLFYCLLILFVFLNTEGFCCFFSTNTVFNCRKLVFVVIQFKENAVLNLHAIWIALLGLSVTVIYHRAAKASRS